jgi:hypothetical protein
MIDYNLITNPMHAKAIWLLANTTLSNKLIGRLINMNYSQIHRIQCGRRNEYYEGIKYPVRENYNDRITGVSRGMTNKFTEEEQAAFYVFETTTLPALMKARWEQTVEEKHLYPAVYEVYQITDPSKNYYGAAKSAGVRASQHFPNSSNPLLAQDMKRLGTDAFSWRVVERIPEELLTDSYLLEREGDWINNQNPYYNFQPGSRPFFLIHSQTLQVVGRFVTISQANKFINIRPDDTNFGRLLHGVGITYKGYHAVYEDEYTEDWQPRKDNRLRGNEYA